MAVLLTATLPLHGQEVYLPPECRVPNPPVGCCTWACLETAGNLLGLSSLRGLTAARERQALSRVISFDGRVVARDDAGGTPARVREEMARRNVRYLFRSSGKKDFDFLRARLTRGVPVSLSLHGYPTLPNGDYDDDAWHAVLLTGISSDTVSVWDPNSPRTILRLPRSFLHTYWTGQAVAISSVPNASPSQWGNLVSQKSTPRLLSLPPLPDDARGRILAALSAGRDVCVQVLREELSLTPTEAEEAANRIWR